MRICDCPRRRFSRIYFDEPSTATTPIQTYFIRYITVLCSADMVVVGGFRVYIIIIILSPPTKWCALHQRRRQVPIIVNLAPIYISRRQYIRRRIYTCIEHARSARKSFQRPPRHVRKSLKRRNAFPFMNKTRESRSGRELNFTP